MESAAGLVLWQAPVSRSAAITPGIAYMMASVLGDVVDRGTGVAARKEGPPDVPMFGKTGTTNDSQDVWFVGATPELVASVWLGYDQPRTLGKSATGGRLAAPVFGRVLKRYYALRPKPAPIPCISSKRRHPRCPVPSNTWGTKHGGEGETWRRSLGGSRPCDGRESFWSSWP